MFEALAAETAAEASHAADHAGDMWAQPETWVAVSFLVVVAFVVLKTWRRVVGALDQRAQRIRKDLDDARALREEAQALLADYEQKQKQALKTADDIIKHARVEAERQRKEAEVNLEATIKRREAQADERIAQAEAQAMREVRGEVVDIAVAAARQVIGEAMDDRRQTAMVDAAISDLPNRLH
ncbi:F0F1 ATP synthase subunit B [Roseospira visakhapatnamensis]|uniref:ATP synthase subunit b n=1 Tax=Roseospira visakhapatnamensis TaxID=390880 RepID=A0A7W6RCB3_9PROT|nr:F0F1 ATP synthase subunit B [Roseospira visakhapatnamensis]MBB4265531.1 F-type H+-transporting ATPase subunit b [Roseospira visakhapatnamensis]